VVKILKADRMRERGSKRRALKVLRKVADRASIDVPPDLCDTL
jgi:hypothetical protein